MNHAKWMEAQISQATYPAKLPPAVLRLMAAKFRDIENAYREKREALYKEEQRILAQRSMLLEDISDAPAHVQRDIARMRELLAQADAIRTRLAENNIELSYDGKGIWRKADPATVAKMTNDIKVRIGEVDAELKRDKLALFDVARELAKEQLVEVQKKIAKVNPEILKRVEAIGAAAIAALPASGTDES